MQFSFNVFLPSVIPLKFTEVEESKLLKNLANKCCILSLQYIGLRLNSQQ